MTMGLAEDLARAYSNSGDVVFDPFSGSGAKPHMQRKCLDGGRS